MSQLPIALQLRRPDQAQGACIVLVDGEHYPAAVSDAIADVIADGWDVRCAALVGGGEKLRTEPQYGVPHVRGSVDDPGPAGALRAALAAAGEGVTCVMDLADEPVLVLERRFELIGIAASCGLQYRAADFVIEPPDRHRVDTPTLGIIGTGKRIGKTAVSAHTARLANAHLGARGDVVVVAMGRGGPAQPIVVDRAGGALTVERLLEISRGGSHAASDYLEDAVLTGLTTVGCRRVSGGLLGVPARSNVPEGVARAEELSPSLILLEGSGSCVPAIDSHATLLLGTTERPQDLLEGLGAYRIGLADLVLVMGNDPAIGEELCHDITARHAVRAIAASLVPRAVGDIRGRRVAAFTTAPAHVAPLVERELARAGADVALVSCHLAQRAELARDLDAARAAGVDALVVEIKAAAIDAVAEFAATHNIDVVFLDNIPRAHDASIDLDAELAQLVDLARNRASQA